MGVYISGIKLPKDEPGAFQVIVMYVGADGKLRAECEGTHEVVPVPPHGRLIDADELETVMSEGIAPSVKDGGFTHPFDIIRAVANAPTIIPAEPLNEEVNE